MNRPGKLESGSGAPDAELGIAKQDMRPVVQRRLDNLQAQVARILERYGVSNFEELKVLGEESPDNVSKEDVDLLTGLAEKIGKIVESGEASYDLIRKTTEAEVSTSGYFRTSPPQSDDGSLVFRGEKLAGSDEIVTEQGAILEGFEWAVTKGDPFVIDGQIVFFAKKDGEDIIVMEDGTEIGVGKGYTQIARPVDVNGQVVFVAEDNDEKLIIQEDGTEIGRGKGYDMVGEPRCIGGQIMFRAARNSKFYIVGEDGTEVRLRYSGVGDPVDIGDTYAFPATRGVGRFIATGDGRELCKRMDIRGIQDIKVIGGKIVFRASVYGTWKVYSEDGFEAGDENLSVEVIQEVNEGIAYSIPSSSNSGEEIIKTKDGRVMCEGAGYSKIYNFNHLSLEYLLYFVLLSVVVNCLFKLLS